VGFVVALVQRFPILVLILVVGAVAFVFRDHLTGAVDDLRVGDCFDRPANLAAGGELSEVQHRPCAESHDAEVIAIVMHPAARTAAYPSDAAVSRFVAEQCVPEFESYTGSSYEAALQWEMGLFLPTDDGWADGDREFTCYVHSADRAKLVRSVRAAPAAGP